MRRTCLSITAFLVATAAQAESIRVEVLYPAASDNAAALRSVQVEPFGGDAGEDLTVQTEDALRGIDLGRGPWLRVIPAATGGGGEALLRGTAETEQRYTEYTEEHERCIKDADGKCTTAREKVTVRCRRRHIELVVALRLIDRDGTLLWSDNRPESFEDTHCEDAEGAPRTRKAVTRDLNAKVARRVWIAFAPRREVEDIRIDEGRKGLSKADGNTFKSAVRLVKDRQISEACSAWSGLAAANPNHVPTRVNIALCAESAGEDAIAAEQYRRVLGLNPKNGMAQRGLERIADRARSQRQIAAHNAD